MRDFDPTASEFISSGYIETSRPGGRLHDPVTAMVGGSVVTGLIGADAAGDAAATQAAAADRATQLQKEMFDKQVELQAPFRQAGLAANNRLAALLGIQNPEFMRGTGTTDATTLESIYQQYLGRSLDPQAATWLTMSPRDVIKGVMQSPEFRGRTQEQQRAAIMPGSGNSDSEFGSLMRRFSMADFEADPGYQFRMDEGMRALEGSAAARGGLLSGAAMKAIQKYGQGVASQEYGNAYNRYTADQTNQYNRLAGLVNTGMGATNQTSNAAANFANNASSNIIGAGNAAAAGQVGAANALVGGINSGINAYQNNQLMQMIQQPSAGGSYGGSTFTPSNYNVAPANYSIYGG